MPGPPLSENSRGAGSESQKGGIPAPERDAAVRDALERIGGPRGRAWKVPRRAPVGAGGGAKGGRNVPGRIGLAAAARPLPQRYGMTGGLYSRVGASAHSMNSTSGVCTSSWVKVKPTTSRARMPSTPSSGSIQNGLIRLGSASAAL